jgi:hypothetical protein
MVFVWDLAGVDAAAVAAVMPAVKRPATAAPVSKMRFKLSPE